MLCHLNRGPLDYARRAQIHRPTDSAALGKEVQRLARNGLTPTDISTALRMNLAQVRELVVGRR